MSWVEEEVQVVSTRKTSAVVCDRCENKHVLEESVNYGTPDGWAYFRVESQVSRHFCPNCVPEVRAQLGLED